MPARVVALTCKVIVCPLMASQSSTKSLEIDMTTQNTTRWIKTAALLLCIAGGVAIALGAHPATAWPANLFIDLAFWPLDRAQNINSDEARFLAAVGGGGFTGFGVMLWRAADKLAVDSSLLFSGLLAWFAIDTTFSIVAGAPMNALYNVAILLIFLVPVLRMKSAAR